MGMVSDENDRILLTAWIVPQLYTQNLKKNTDLLSLCRYYVSMQASFIEINIPSVVAHFQLPEFQTYILLSNIRI